MAFCLTVDMLSEGVAKVWGSGEEKGPIGQVLPTFIVALNTGRLSASRLATLEQFAQLISGQGERTCYRITPESVEQGRSRGITSREIMFLLRHINGCNLPENVAAEVGEWAERFGEGVLQRAVWLRGEPASLPELGDITQGAKLLAQTGEETVFLSDLRLEELATALRARGVFPSAHRLEKTMKVYASPVIKENGIFNYSMRAVHDLYCSLRDNSLPTMADPAERLFKRWGQQLGISERTAKTRREGQVALRAFASQRMWDAHVRLVRLYLTDHEYSEIGGFDQLISDQVVRELDHLRQPQQVRQKMGDYLCEINPHEWTSLLPFVRRLRKESPKVIRATRSWDWSYLRRQDHPWEEIEDYWLMHLLTHEFWWLGIVELYWTKSHGPTAFRLTPDGLALLSGQEPGPRPSIVMAPAGWTVLEPQLMTVEEVVLLMQFAEDQPLTCQWNVRWDRETIHDAVINGTPLSSLLELLHKHCPEIPVELLNHIAELGRQGERLAIEEGYLLTCKEPVLLTSLLAVKSLALCIAERLSPTVAVVYPAALNRLLRGSERNGISIDDRTEIVAAYRPRETVVVKDRAKL